MPDVATRRPAICRPFRADAHRLLLPALIALALAGCTSLDDRGQLPAAPVAREWPADASTPGDRGLVASELRWRDYFADPRLISVIETALENNRDLRLALLRVEEARAAYGIQRAAQFPAVGIGAQGARSRVPGDLNASGRSLVGSDYQVFVGLSSWELDLWGRVRSLREAALEQYLATEAARRAAHGALIATVADAWLELRELDERIALAQETIRTREESLRIFRLRTEAGSASMLELTQVQTLLNQAHALTVQLQRTRSARAHALTLLVGAPVDPAPADDGSTRDDIVFAPLRAGLPADLLTARPDILSAERQLAAARANIQAARAAFFPRIALTGSLGTASADLDRLFESGTRAWTFVPVISLPIFDGGLRRAGLDLAEVRSDMAVTRYEQTIQAAFRDVADALSAGQWLREQLAIQRQSVDTLVERARLAQLRYDSGAATYLEVLDAQRDLLDARQQWVQVRRNLLSSQVALYAALGGGTEDPIGTTARSAVAAPVP